MYAYHSVQRDTNFFVQNILNANPEAPLNILKYKYIYRDTRFICSMLVRVTKVQQDLSADICMVH